MQKKFKDEILEMLHNDIDVICRTINCAGHTLDIIFISEIVEHKELNLNILKPLLEFNIDSMGENSSKIAQNEDFLAFIKDNVLAVGGIKDTDDIVLACKKVEGGEVLIICDDKKDKILDIKISNPPHRSVVEPPTSVVINGPHEGFIEDYKTNVALIRKRLITDELVLKTIHVGRYTKTRVAVMYLKDVADLKVANRIIQKIKKIDIDAIIDSQYIVEYLEQRPNSLFKQVGKTEKPDVVCSKLLEGRVAILVDGSPVILTIPFILIEDFQSGDDYYQKNYRVILIRIIRFFGIVISVILPGGYVAVQLYYYEIMPLKFLTTIINTTQGLPLTPLIEILFVILLFEVLYEASVRMPVYLGMALSIVGALILGDTAVKAGLVSSPSVMIVAMSGITIYTTPQLSGELSILRLLYVLAGGMLSFFGIVLLTLFLASYLSDFDNYGTPYLSPFSPDIAQDKKDAILKKNLLAQKTRPKSIVNKNFTRQE